MRSGAAAKGPGPEPKGAAGEGGREAAAYGGASQAGEKLAEAFGALSREVSGMGSTMLRPKRCMQCVGTGQRICRTCMARGKVGGCGLDARSKECAVCQGEGLVPCGACKATGITNNWLFQPAKNPGWGPRGEVD